MSTTSITILQCGDSMCIASLSFLGHLYVSKPTSFAPVKSIEDLKKNPFTMFLKDDDIYIKYTIESTTLSILFTLSKATWLGLAPANQPVNRPSLTTIFNSLKFEQQGT
jgi:hypothetical protein